MVVWGSQASAKARSSTKRETDRQHQPHLQEIVNFYRDNNNRFFLRYRSVVGQHRVPRLVRKEGANLNWKGKKDRSTKTTLNAKFKSHVLLTSWSCWRVRTCSMLGSDAHSECRTGATPASSTRSCSVSSTQSHCTNIALLTSNINFGVRASELVTRQAANNACYVHI